jgi:hypothetical protein
MIQQLTSDTQLISEILDESKIKLSITFTPVNHIIYSDIVDIFNTYEYENFLKIGKQKIEQFTQYATEYALEHWG